mgnify:CR=1 FL=1
MPLERYQELKTVTVTNNCPECFNQELNITFSQKHLYSKFVHQTTAEVTHKIQCLTCNSEIFPSQWTEDIERVFDYYKKTVVAKPKKRQYTKLFYLYLGSIAFVIAAIIYGVIQL